MSRLKKGSACAAAAVACIGGFEGLRQNAYPDPATKGHPWTICYGETAGVKPGDRKSIQECKDLLVKSLDGYADKIERCLVRPVPDARFVGFLSLSYNIGWAGFCRSSVVRLYNEGKVQESCDAMLRFNRAAGVVFPGLTRRREAERRLCMQGDL